MQEEADLATVNDALVNLAVELDVTISDDVLDDLTHRVHATLTSPPTGGRPGPRIDRK